MVIVRIGHGFDISQVLQVQGMYFLYSNDKYLLSTYSMPGLFLSAGDRVVYNTDKPPSDGACLFLC